MEAEHLDSVCQLWIALLYHFLSRGRNIKAIYPGYHCAFPTTFICLPKPSSYAVSHTKWVSEWVSESAHPLHRRRCSASYEHSDSKWVVVTFRPHVIRSILSSPFLCLFIHSFYFSFQAALLLWAWQNPILFPPCSFGLPELMHSLLSTQTQNRGVFLGHEAHWQSVRISRVVADVVPSVGIPGKQREKV